MDTNTKSYTHIENTQKYGEHIWRVDKAAEGCPTDSERHKRALPEGVCRDGEGRHCVGDNREG